MRARGHEQLGGVVGLEVADFALLRGSSERTHGREDRRVHQRPSLRIGVYTGCTYTEVVAVVENLVVDAPAIDLAVAVDIVEGRESSLRHVLETQSSEAAQREGSTDRDCLARSVDAVRTRGTRGQHRGTRGDEAQGQGGGREGGEAATHVHVLHCPFPFVWGFPQSSH